MKIYNYDRYTGEFVSITRATPNPLEAGKYLIPAYATSVACPEAKEGYVRCFIESTSKWEYKEDHRGEIIYKTSDKTKTTMLVLGKIPEGYTLLEPLEFSNWNGSEWVVDERLRIEFLVKTIKLKAEEVITSKYPLYKQLNILMNGDTDEINVMNAFITNIRNISNKAEVDLIELDKINWES